MEATRPYYLHLHRRHPSGRRFIHYSIRKPQQNSFRFGTSGMVNSNRKIDSNSHTKDYIPWPPFRLRKWQSLYPRRQRNGSTRHNRKIEDGRNRKIFDQHKIYCQVIGKLEFLSLAEPAIMPFLDRLRKQMCNRVELKGWNSTMVVNRGPIKDLKFLKNILMNSKGNWLELESPEPIVINSDASLSGFAVHSSNLIVVGQFQEESSINVKELKAINQFFTEASQQELFPRGTHFEIRGDNQPSLVYVKKGYGSIDHLSLIARELWTTLKKKDWHISKTVYIPTEMNKIADRLSRLGDWKSSQELINLVEEEFGHHTRPIRKIRISSNNHLQQLAGKRCIQSTL